MTELIAGPDLSTSAIRSRYFRTRDFDVYLPEANPCCSSEMVSSSSSKDSGGIQVFDLGVAAITLLGVPIAAAHPRAVFCRKRLRFICAPHFRMDRTFLITLVGVGYHSRLTLKTLLPLTSTLSSP